MTPPRRSFCGLGRGQGRAGPDGVDDVGDGLHGGGGVDLADDERLVRGGYNSVEAVGRQRGQTVLGRGPAGLLPLRRGDDGQRLAAEVLELLRLVEGGRHLGQLEKSATNAPWAAGEAADLAVGR